MKKRLLIVVLAMVMVLAIGLTACQDKTCTLTLFDTDGTTVISTVEVAKGEAPAKPADPTKEGYVFVGWFITPTNKTEYDFSKALEEDAAAYAQWKVASYDDQRDWVASGTFNSWGATAMADWHFTKKSGETNVFEITLNLQVGYEFKFTVLREDGTLDYNDTENGADIGFAALSNPGEYFEGKNGLGYAPKNICVLEQGNYTFTITTDPVNSNNTASVVRNGDAVVDVTTKYNYYIKGEKVTDWKNMYNPATELVLNEETGKHELEVYLVAGEQFLIYCIETTGETSVEGAYYKQSNVAEDSLDNLTDGAGDNLYAKTTGMHKIVLDTETSKISIASIDETYAPAAADYYLDGDFDSELAAWNGYCFSEKYKLVKQGETDIYVIEHVELAEGKQFIIQAFKAGATARGEWGTDSYTGLGSYNFLYVTAAGDNFSTVDLNNENIKVLKASTYKITFNAHAKVITIEDENVNDDAYINGNMTGSGWQIVADWKMSYDEATQKYTITKAFEVGNEFGVKVCIGADTTAQRAWVGKANVVGEPAGFDLTGGNIKCTTAGTYTITVDMSNADAPTITIVAAE